MCRGVANRKLSGDSDQSSDGLRAVGEKTKERTEVRLMKSLNSEERLMEKMFNAHPSAESACRDNRSASVRRRQGMPTAFTMLELLIVVVILGIAAMTAIPMMSSAGSIQTRSAANALAADLAYAKSLAISRGQDYAVVFDTTAESYQIEDMFGIVVDHPVKKGFKYIVNLANEGLDRVDLYSADFDDSSTSITFDCLGSPKDLNSEGTVVFQSNENSMTVSVEPVTGYITIN